AFRRAAAHGIYEDGQRSVERFDAFSGGIDETRVRDEPEFTVAGFHHTKRHTLVDKVSGDAHEHRGKPAGVAAKIDDDPVGAPEFVHRLLKLRIDSRHPDIERDHARGLSGSRRLPLLFNPDVHRRKVADRHGIAVLGPALEGRFYWRPQAVLEGDLDL